jgi:hypothetical protein
MPTNDSQETSRERVRLFHNCLQLLFVALLFQTLSLRAQSKPGYFDATNLHQPTELSATWLIHAGDDPDGSKGWAQPGFDDSNWTPCDPSKSLHSYFPQGNPGFVWYRLHIKVAPIEPGLALEEWGLGSAVTVFMNGATVFQIGRMAPYVPYTSGEQLLAVIPEHQIATGNLVLAVRVHLSNPDWNTALPGLYYVNLVLGQAEALRDRMWLFGIGYNWLYCLDGLLSLGLGIASILLYSAESRRREYLWLTIICACSIIGNCLLVSSFLRNIPVAWWSIHLIPIFATNYAGARMYLALSGRAVGWRLGTFLAVACLLTADSQTDQLSFFVLNGFEQTVLMVPYLVLIVGMIPTILVSDWRRGNREAGILLIPLILGNFVLIYNVIIYALTQIPALRDWAARYTIVVDHSRIGPFLIIPASLASILFSLVMGLIILLRTNRLSRQGAVFESELAAAREVQQVLVPEAIETIPGFTIETAYIPAQQVGGDFFQILPTPHGGLLLVLGDVAGKGLPAAMLVSVLVGAIRTVADTNYAPDQMLVALNSRMFGRSNGGFSTALAAHIDANGKVSIANAGHLSPYLNGREIELPGALPLGIVREATYPTCSFELAPSSRLTFYSDGVIEAQDAKGHLFGFDRGQAISGQSAVSIAERAKIFGQSDDITVIAIIRENAQSSNVDC